MAVYDLERFHILLVEDNGYIRNVLENLLRQFRVGRVATASNGQEAIAYLQMVAKQGAAARRDLDVVISDMIMNPINGLLVLRWLRSAKESPNRFLPFIMLSGAADSEYVISARDSGLTEFMAKPFTEFGEAVFGRSTGTCSRSSTIRASSSPPARISGPIAAAETCRPEPTSAGCRMKARSPSSAAPTTLKRGRIPATSGTSACPTTSRRRRAA